jgi:(S)-ureidoglycine aminohydrolase
VTYSADYWVPTGGLPPQTALTTGRDGRARFTEAYAVVPAGTQSDITASYLPGWDGMRMWVLARPLSGFAETFSWYVTEVSPGGGSSAPESDPAAEAVLFVVSGTLALTVVSAGGEASYELAPGGYAYVPPDTSWRLANETRANATFHWIRKRYVPAPGVDVPEFFVANEREVTPVAMPGTDGVWSTTRFVDIDDLRHDMHVNIVNFQPGGTIPFPETHVMEHGLYVLEGKAVYLLNTDWVEVEAGDFMWLRAFCPQACYAGGPGPFRYLLYKDVNRHASLDL